MTIKIKQNFKIQEDGVTIKGRILDCQFTGDSKREDEVEWLSEDKKFYIISSARPYIYIGSLSVWGGNKSYDNVVDSYEYDTKEEAQQVMKYINEFTIKEEEEEYFETEEQIQGGFTPEMIELLCKDPKYKNISSKDILKQIDEMVEKDLKKKKVWSDDGRLIDMFYDIKNNLEKDGGYVIENDKEKYLEEHDDDSEYIPLAREIVKNQEVAKLERERRQVEFFMKKFACLSRDDNSWQRIFGKCQYDIQMDFDKRVKIGVQFKINTNTIDFYLVAFNKAYFYSEEDAQECLDHLLEKYGKKRLKKIWGMK